MTTTEFFLCYLEYRAFVLATAPKRRPNSYEYTLGLWKTGVIVGAGRPD